MKALRKALKIELSNNPFRSFLASLQTIAILIGVSQYMVRLWNPPSTFFDVSTLMLQIDTNGTFSGDIILSTDSGPSIKQLDGQVYGVDLNVQTQRIRNIHVLSIGSGQASKIALLRVQKPPAQILFCLHGKNIEGATLKQRLLLEQDASTTSELLKGQLAACRT